MTINREQIWRDACLRAANKYLPNDPRLAAIVADRSGAIIPPSIASALDAAVAAPYGDVDTFLKEWSETEHPREHGQFAAKPGAGDEPGGTAKPDAVQQPVQPTAKPAAAEDLDAPTPPPNHLERADRLIGEVRAARQAGKKLNPKRQLQPLGESLNELSMTELQGLRDKHGLKADAAVHEKLADQIQREVRAKRKLATPAPTATRDEVAEAMAKSAKIRSFANDAAGHAWASQRFDKWAKELTPEQTKAIQAWTESGGINDALRGLPTATGSGLVSRHVVNLDAALEAGKLTEPVTLWRGIGSELPFDLTTMVGGVWKDAGYTSGTYSYSEAAKWAENDAPERHPSQAVLKIAVPAGTPAGFTDMALRGKLGQDASPPREILLGRGLQYRVIGADRPGENGNTLNVPVVQLEVVSAPSPS